VGLDPRFLEVVVDDGGGVHAAHRPQRVDQLGNRRRRRLVVVASVSCLPQVKDVLRRTRSAREERHVPEHSAVKSTQSGPALPTLSHVIGHTPPDDTTTQDGPPRLVAPGSVKYALAY